MSPAWPHLVNAFNKFIFDLECYEMHVITFDNESRVNTNKNLSTNLNDHGGNTTDIVGAFKLFE